jgi:hypothetical protein
MLFYAKKKQDKKAQDRVRLEKEVGMIKEFPDFFHVSTTILKIQSRHRDGKWILIIHIIRFHIWQN